MYWSERTSARERLWQSLAAGQAAEVCRRSLASAEEDGYALAFLDRRYLVAPQAGRIGGPRADPLLADAEFELLLLTYLTQSGDLPSEGSWISEKALPGGSLFFRGPHALPLQPLLGRFGNDLPAFRRAAETVGGRSLPYGDAAYGFTALPRIPAGCVLWAGDDEFPARVNMLFDRTLGRHLPLDAVLALVHCLALRLVEAAAPTA